METILVELTLKDWEGRIWFQQHIEVPEFFIQDNDKQHVSEKMWNLGEYMVIMRRIEDGYAGQVYSQKR
jgi:hypothetical protein